MKTLKKSLAMLLALVMSLGCMSVGAWATDGEPEPVTAYDVTFDSDGGSDVAKQTVNAGATATEPEDPTKDGYTFEGWQLDGADYDFNTPVTADITLKATWEAVPVNVARVGSTEYTTIDASADGASYTGDVKLKSGTFVVKYTDASQFTGAVAPYYTSNVLKVETSEADANGVVTRTYSLSSNPAVAAIGNVKYDSLETAIAEAKDGDIVTLLKSADISTRFNISKSMTIDGDGLTNATIKIDNGDNRVFDISGQEDVTFTLKKVYADGSESGISSTAYARGVSLYSNKNVKLVLDDASVSSPYYAINIGGENKGVDVEMKNASASAGWSAFNVWSPATITVSESELSGNNDKSNNNSGWNNFGTIVMNKGSAGSKLLIEDSTVIARMNGNLQLLLDIRDDDIEATFKNVNFKSYGTVAADAKYAYNMIGLYDNDSARKYAATNTKLIFDGCKFYKDDVEVETVDELFSYLRCYNLETYKSTFVFNGVQYFFDNSYECYRADYATLATNENREFIGGLFYDDPSANVADGYAAVKMTDGTWKVGPVSSASTEIITTGKDTYTVTTTVKESEKANAAVLSESSASVSVQPETVAAAEVKTTDTVSLANVKTKKVAETAAAMAVAAGATEATDINVTIKLEKKDDTAEQSANLSTTFGGAQEVFEVHPVATYTATKTVDNVVTELKTETFTIANDDLEGSFTFNLYLDSGKYGTGDNALKAGDLVTVTHYKDGGGTETWTKKVQSEGDDLYVALTLDSFSHIAVKAAAAGATVDYTVKIADATSGTAVIYPGDSVTMDVTVSGDDFYGGDFTIEYDNTAFVKVEESFAAGINPQDPRSNYESADNRLNYNLVKDGARLTDGSKIFSVTFTAKSDLTETDTYDFKVVDARVNYDNTKNADIVDCTENSTFVTNDTVKVNATKFTVKFDGVSKDWTEQVYAGKGVDTIPTDVKTGYTFKGWALTNTATTALTDDAIRNAAVTAAVTYYPVFEAEQYNVTLTGTTTDADPAKATFGQDYTATISDYDANNYDYTVTYKSGTDASKTLDLSAESNFNAATGKFTIPAADITGKLNVTVEKTLKGFEVELHADYVTGYTLVLVRAAEGNNSNPIYTYGASGENTGAMFFVKELTKDDQSKVYGAYAILVEGAITQSAARAKVGITTTTATELTIQTDVNATGRIDSSDLQAAFSGYKVQLTLPEQMAIYLRADVNGDYKLDTADVGLVNSARTK